MKILAVIKKEYREIVKKKSFIISTLLMPLLMAAMIFLPVWLMKAGRGEKKIAVADFTGQVFGELQATAGKPAVKEKFQLNTEKAPAAVAGKLIFQAVEITGADDETLIGEYQKKIIDKEVDGFLMIPADIKSTRKALYYSMNVSDFDTNRIISSSIRTILAKTILLEKEIDPLIVNEATRDVDLDTFKVKKEGVSKSSSGMEYMLSIMMLTFLFSILMGYGQLIQRGIIEEKTNRIIEVLISSLHPHHLFYGKITGIGLAGLTQVLIWILFGVVLLVGKFFPAVDQSLQGLLTPEIAIYFIVFFVLGFVMYSILFAIIGASVNTDQEAQQLGAPVIYMLMIPFFVGMMVTQNPHSPIAVVISLIPLFTPLLMFMRIVVSMPPLIQVFASILLSIGTIMFLAWVGAKIFRTGILMYGKKPTLGEILRWVRYK